jgi:hypothetical protein
MEDNITLDALELLTSADDTADNSVKKIKNGVKQYSERLNKDREKIKNQLEADYKSTLSQFLGVEIKELTQKDIDDAINLKIENSDVVKKANQIIEENNAKLIQQNIDDNINKIKALNPSIDSVDKLCTHPQYDAIKAKVDKGYELYDAYISVVGVSSSPIPNNMVRKGVDSKTVTYVQPDTISDATLSFYRKAFPGKTDAEILELYKRDNK